MKKSAGLTLKFQMDARCSNTVNLQHYNPFFSDLINLSSTGFYVKFTATTTFTVFSKTQE